MIPDEKVFQGYYPVRGFLKRCCRLKLLTEHTLNKTLDDWRERDQRVQKERQYAMEWPDHSGSKLFHADRNA